jgi:EmrB/QacA subfamily drug resistance transporter
MSSTAETGSAAPSDLLAGKRRWILAACMAAMFMAAVEATIVATAMPTIVASLGGFSIFGWVFSAYLLATAVSVPIYGRLADLYGRKRVFFAGASLFLLGSALCGFAGSMPALILFRALQGLGGGAIMPITQTIIGDIYTPTERGRVQGCLSSVWGISAIIGPLLGAAIVQHLHWSLVFWVNLPIGPVAMALLATYFVESTPPRQHRLDIAGGVLTLLASGGVMLALLQAASLGWWIIPLLIVAGVSGVLLIYQERRAPEPMLPPVLWRNRTILAANLGGFAIGAVMMGVSAFLPTYVQGVMGRSALVGGGVLAAMSLGWPIAATLCGRLMLVTSYRVTAILGGACLVLGALVLTGLDPARGPFWAAAGAFLIGCGMGMSNTTFVVAAQNAASWQLRGIATSSTMFMRMIGSALGTAMLGAALNLSLVLHPPGIGDPVQTLMDPARRTLLPAAQLDQLVATVGASLANVYWLALALALLALSLAWVTPGRIGLGYKTPSEQGAE